MKKNSSSFRNFLRATRGANMVEYIILVGVVAIVGLGAFGFLGRTAEDRVRKQGDSLTKVRAEGDPNN